MCLVSAAVTMSTPQAQVFLLSPGLQLPFAANGHSDSAHAVTPVQEIKLFRVSSLAGVNSV